MAGGRGGAAAGGWSGRSFSQAASRALEEKLRVRDLPAHLSAHLPAHQFPSQTVEAAAGAEPAIEEQVEPSTAERLEWAEACDRRQRVYRVKTVAMLRRYMRYSIETGRLPSLLGKEFFRAKVTARTAVTFEDQVIFAHDMEKCVERLDEFSKQLIARHILQEHDLWATAKLLHCNEKTVRRCTPMALDLLSEILLNVGLLQPMESDEQKSCQGGKTGPFSASDCEDGKYKRDYLLDTKVVLCVKFFL